ncbi:MAG: histidine triad nucleotide-binding protein [Chthonomonadales bacterium]|nr:histidine triad nucleotide-binding protein [Chthonomonadales bacterium]
MPEDCVFCKIADGRIPADLVYEDAEFVAFRDIDPQAPAHVVLIPRAHVPTLLDLPDRGAAGGLLLAANETARRLGLAESGFRLVGNCGPDAGQEVPHVHVHVLGGRCMGWPPG